MQAVKDIRISNLSDQTLRSKYDNPKEHHSANRDPDGVPPDIAGLRFDQEAMCHAGQRRYPCVAEIKEIVFSGPCQPDERPDEDRVVEPIEAPP